MNSMITGEEGAPCGRELLKQAVWAMTVATVSLNSKHLFLMKYPLIQVQSFDLPLEDGK